jgi:hypothetical protein
MFKNVSLANEVICFVVQILGGESGLVDPVEIEVTLADEVLLDQLDRLRFIRSGQVLLSFGAFVFERSHFGS